MNRLFIFFPFLLVLLTACPKKDDVEETKEDEIPLVSQFVYDGMSSYYLWSGGMLSKEPTVADKNPETYFSTLLSSVDTQHGWSWITDDVDALLAEFSGSPKDFGWSLALYRVSGSNTNVVGVVKYVFPNTPAANAGVVRGEIVNQIDGTNLTLSNYTRLFEGVPVTVGIVNPVTSTTRNLPLTPVLIETNPVLIDTVFKDQPAFAGKKIGYLFYTDFISEFNGKLFEAFTKFKSEGITDLVVDLRYNHGGAITAAAYLASLIAPRTVVESHSVFTTLTYNDFVNAAYQSQGVDRNAYFVNSGSQNPLAANLNLNKVYIIATDDSYSASELLAHCLKPYMDVVHIGSKTGGKFTGSWTIHAYDSYGNEAVPVYQASSLSNEEKQELKNWAMQPIVAIYKDKNGVDFSAAGALIPNYPIESIEGDPSIWKPLGASNDYLVAKAVSLITGLPVAASAPHTTTARSVYQAGAKKLFSPRDNRLKESVQLEVPTKISNDLMLKTSARRF